MNFLLKAFLVYRRKSEKGFAIPMVLSLGIIMILLSSITIFKSQEEDIIAITQRSTSRALSAAEAGTARYRELINKNRNLAIYDSSSWPPSGKPICDSNTTITNAISDWQSVDNTDASLGQYRLIGYDYLDTNNGDPPNDTTRGTLTVEGKVNDATARVKVQIPVRPEDPSDNLQPGLWLGGSPTNIGNLKVGGNIIVKALSESGCTIPNLTANLENANTQLIIADPRPLPSIPSQPSSSIINEVTSAQLTSASILPRPGDKADANNFYHYKVTNALNISEKDLKINSGTKVILYVEGDSITFNGNTTVNANNSSPYLEIYGSDSTTVINFTGSGTININALIHAPEATATVSGSPTISIDGAMWVKDWNGSSSNSITITPDETSGNSSYSFYSSKPAYESKPTIHRPNSWETVEAN